MDDSPKPKAPSSGVQFTVESDVDLARGDTVHSLQGSTGKATPPPVPAADADLGGDGTLLRIQNPGATLDLPAGPSKAGPGSRVGRYLLLDLIAAGGMGEVFAAWDPDLDRKVALKLVRTTFLQQLGADLGRARLIREAQAMAKLSHPNIVTVHDVGGVGDQVFIAMEFLDGQPVSAWIDSEKRAWTELLSVFLDAGRGLAAAHKAGIIHRDFKRENVIRTKDGRVCVLDFGIARAPNMPVTEKLSGAADDVQIVVGGTSLTQAGAVMGTPGYMSPEQYRGEEVDARTDQFSFCVALYESLYGSRPFTGNTLGELRRKSESGEIPPPPPGTAVPAWIFEVLRKGLKICRLIAAHYSGAIKLP